MKRKNQHPTRSMPLSMKHVNQDGLAHLLTVRYSLFF
jgi:hypothetical protein